jgi:hypothetical protein
VSRLPFIALGLAAAAAGSALAAAPTATPTPTPALRRLSGGFGKGAPPDAVVTPAPASQPPSGDQPLADAVRAARESKKRKEARGTISITNENLVTDPKKGKITTSSPRNTPVKEKASAEHPTPAASADAEAEAYWRERAHTARSRVADLEETIRRLEQEAKKLENDFYSWDDGNYRDGVIKPAWDRKREELETARRELVTAQKELADLPEKARKAGALPGWLRE